MALPMIFLRRDRPRSTRFVYLRLALLFASVALWMAGVRLENDVLTMIAMAVVVVAIAIGLSSRAEPAGEGRDEEAEEARRR